jgi:serine/threonine protein kinase
MKTSLVHKCFWKEIESVGNAKHRNLVRLLGLLKCGEVGFLLNDYVSNGDLRAALHDKEQGLVLNWKERLRIAEGVAHGLAYLHHTYSPPVVHRDITSSNVLLDHDLEAKISDFGLSKVLDTQPKSQQRSSTSPAVLGTYGYIAPCKHTVTFFTRSWLSHCSCDSDFSGPAENFHVVIIHPLSGYVNEIRCVDMIVFGRGGV